VSNRTLQLEVVLNIVYFMFFFLCFDMVYKYASKFYSSLRDKRPWCRLKRPLNKIILLQRYPIQVEFSLTV
jgi:hypothetical protein